MAPMRVRAVTASDAVVLASAVALRWSRPDLTAALAEHVGEASTGDDRTWVAAAGWLVHGRAAIGDGRQCASDALAEIARRGADLLDDPAADRLRIEVAMLAAGQREPAMARLLVGPLLAADRSAEVRADALGVLARCVMEERPAAIGEATRRAEVVWGEIGGPPAEIAGAALALLSAAALRRSGHPDSAVEHAAAGLARLDGLRALQEGAPSRHLAAALGAEWLTSLIEAGRADDACEGCMPMAQQLQETTRPTRQIALLRLAVARALADSTSLGAVEALEQAAQDAADCDTPDLEGLCLSTLGALREQTGRLDAALESMRRGVAAQRRDRARSERFRAALSEMALGSPSARAGAVVGPLDRRERAPADLTRKHSPSETITPERNLPERNVVEPVHPLAAGGDVDPWSTGRWANQAAVSSSGEVAVDGGGRRRRASRAKTEPNALAAAGVSASDVAEDGGPTAEEPAHIGDADSAAAGLMAGAGAPDVERLAKVGDNAVEVPVTDQAETVEFFWGPAPDSGGIEDIPVPHEDRSAHLVYDGERWLEDALAELDRVWGQPLPDLERLVVLPAETAVAPAASGPVANGRAVDDQGSHPLATGQPAVVGSADGRDAVAPDVIGCVVVIDVVRAGASVPDVGGVLREVGDRLTRLIPAGARLRCEVDESALSVVLPGRERSAATDWMQQTLPAVFADMADLGVARRWATGTTLQAVVHDTDGPVGAQLLQRLDLVAPRSPVPRAQHDVASPAVVRWGVPILAGSGGRRRRPDDAADHPVEPPSVPPADAPGRHRDAPEAAPPDSGRIGADHVTGDAAGLLADPPESVSAQRRMDPARVACEDNSAFSVEGLGLADLLAGALAAYRGI